MGFYFLHCNIWKFLVSVFPLQSFCSFSIECCFFCHFFCIFFVVVENSASGVIFFHTSAYVFFRMLPVLRDVFLSGVCHVVSFILFYVMICEIGSSGLIPEKSQRFPLQSVFPIMFLSFLCQIVSPRKKSQGSYVFLIENICYLIWCADLVIWWNQMSKGSRVVSCLFSLVPNCFGYCFCFQYSSYVRFFSFRALFRPLKTLSAFVSCFAFYSFCKGT